MLVDITGKMDSRADGSSASVVDDALMSAIAQTLYHIGSHSAEPYHANLHSISPYF